MVSLYESIGFQYALYETVICCLVLLLRLFCFVYCVCFSIFSSLLLYLGLLYSVQYCGYSYMDLVV